MRKHRLLSIVLIVALCFAALVGCGQQPDQGSGGGAATPPPSGGGSAEKITLRIASAETNPVTMEKLQAIGKEYQELTGVEVIAEAVPLADIYSKVSATLHTSSQYDIFLTGFVGHIAIFHKMDLLEPLDDIIDAIGGRADFNEKILFLIDGSAYWVPYDYNLSYGYIRTDWLAEKGLEVPKTWADMVTVAKAFTDKANNKYGLILPLKSDTATNWISTGFLWGNGVKIFDDNWNVILDSAEIKPKVVEVLNLMKELYAYMPPGIENVSYSEEIAGFTSGQAGMAFYSGRIVDTIEEKEPGLADKYAVFGYPTKTGEGSAVTFGYDGMAVLKSEQSQAAKDFVKWFYQEKIVEFLHTVPIHLFPAQDSIYENEEWRSNALIQKHWETGVAPQYDLLKNAVMASVDTDGPYMDEKPGMVLEANLFPKMFQRVLLNNEDPGTVVDETAAEIRTLVAGK